MNHKGLRRFALALLSCLACPVAGHALTCPPGQIEVNGRCYQQERSNEKPRKPQQRFA